MPHFGSKKYLNVQQLRYVPPVLSILVWIAILIKTHTKTNDYDYHSGVSGRIVCVNYKGISILLTPFTQRKIGIWLGMPVNTS